MSRYHLSYALQQQSEKTNIDTKNKTKKKTTTTKNKKTYACNSEKHHCNCGNPKQTLSGHNGIMDKTFPNYC